LTPTYSLFTFNRSAEGRYKNTQSGGRRPAYPKHISQGAAPKTAPKKPKAGECGPHIQSIFHKAQRRRLLQRKNRRAAITSFFQSFLCKQENGAGRHFRRADSSPGRADYNPGRADYNPGRADYNPRPADYNPRPADYNPPHTGLSAADAAMAPALRRIYVNMG
jgi:hypothetical protein